MSDKLLDLAAKYALKKQSPNFIRALKEYYGDSFDISFRDNREIYKRVFEYYTTALISSENSYDVCAIAHYPELTVKNYLGEKHIIKDVYIQYYFDSNLCFKIARTTFTLAELERGYVFSHLICNSSYNNGGFSSSCLGNGPLNNISIFPDATVEEFKFYFQLVTDYLQWESIGGVPYVKFSSIRPKITSTTTIATRLVKDFLTKFPKGAKIKVTYDCIEVDYTEDFELNLAEYLYRNGINNVLAYKVDDEYLSYKENVLTLRDRDKEKLDDTLSKELFYYKGEFLKTKLYDGISIKPTGKLYPIPSVTRQVCNALAENLTRNYIMSSGSIGKKDIIENTQVCYQEDPIPVQ